MFRKLLYSALLALAVQGSGYAQSTASIGSLSLSDSCAFVNLPISAINGNVYVSNYSPGMTLNLYWGDGDSTINVSGNSFGYFWTNHVYAIPGNYTVAAVLMNSMTPIDTVTQTLHSFCSTIVGRGYKRADNNCVYDPMTEPVVTTPFDLVLKENGTPVDTFQTNGYIYFRPEAANLSSEFSLSVLTPPTGMITACPGSPITFRFDTLYYTNGNPFQFAFDCDPNYTWTDLFVSGSGFFRPVSNSYIYIAAGNDACDATPGTITLKISPKYSYASAYPTPTSVSGNTVTWDYSALNNTSYVHPVVMLNPVGTLNLGDTVMNKVTITPLSGDLDTNNNTMIIIDSIRASWDPNNKQVNPEGPVLAGSVLTYTINFENTGNDTAFNIHILDTLSHNLNLKTLRVIASSDPVNYQLFTTSGEQVLRFDFAGIRLPDAAQAPGNQGFVTYQIEAKSDLTPGMVINNSAAIYFDINPPIYTNVTTSEIPAPNGIIPTENPHAISVYPNPSQDKLYVVHLNRFDKVEISNAVGQTVLRQVITPGTKFISTRTLVPGLYFLKATNSKGAYIQKFIRK
ncbi:MAG TPA: T9SS type A sorting domain-containing protein [Edaphocola sp.]|nr:T9SS type A sorting domain-containing protein [Edaphocola sp.]